MSRARGRPVKLASGRCVEGPRAMRSDDYPLGLPWLPGHAQARIRRSNDMFTFSLNRLKRRLKSLGVAVIEHFFLDGSFLSHLSFSIAFQFSSSFSGVVGLAVHVKRAQPSFTTARACTKLCISLNVLAITC